MVGKEYPCGDICGQALVTCPTCLPKGSQAEQERGGPLGKVESPRRWYAAPCSTAGHPPRSWGVEPRLGARCWASASYALPALLPGWAWFFRGRAVAPSSWLLGPHSGPPVCVEWTGVCSVQSLQYLGALAVVLKRKRMLVGNEPVKISPTAFNGMWCVSMCGWGP